MTWPTKEPTPLTGPVQKSEVTTTDSSKVSGRFLQALASLPFWVPSWLDRLALRAAKRLGREGKL